MGANFGPLLGILDEMVAVHSQLAQLSTEKQQVIIKNDTARLSAIAQQEMRLMHQSTALDKKRAQAAAALAHEAGLPGGEITVSQLISIADENDRARLAGIRKELGALLSTQKSLNEINRGLLETHIEYTDLMLNLMVGPEDPLNNIYGAQGAGEKEKRHSAGLFDTQI